jgi:hypothetical protein
VASQTDCFNAALTLLGERRIASLSEDAETVRVLLALWNPTMLFCLEQGIWSFAMRIATVAQSGDGTAAGMTYAFEPPTDLIHVYQVGNEAAIDPAWADANFIDHGPAWYGNAATLYVHYTSDNGSYGTDTTLWPETFAQYAAAYLAHRAAYRLTGSLALTEQLDILQTRRLANALSVYGLWKSIGREPLHVASRWEAPSSRALADKLPNLNPLNTMQAWAPPRLQQQRRQQEAE